MELKVLFAGIMIALVATAKWWLPFVLMAFRNAMGPREPKHGEMYEGEDNHYGC